MKYTSEKTQFIGSVCLCYMTVLAPVHKLAQVCRFLEQTSARGTNSNFSHNFFFLFAFFPRPNPNYSRPLVCIVVSFCLSYSSLLKAKAKVPFMRIPSSQSSVIIQAATWKTGTVSIFHNPMASQERPHLEPGHLNVSPHCCPEPPRSSPSPKQRSSLT